jgi:hypothetical protein
MRNPWALLLFVGVLGMVAAGCGGPPRGVSKDPQVLCQDEVNIACETMDRCNQRDYGTLEACRQTLIKGFNCANFKGTECPQGGTVDIGEMQACVRKMELVQCSDLSQLYECSHKYCY